MCLICNQFINTNRNAFCSKCKENFIPIIKSNRINKLLVSDGLDAARSGWYFTQGLDDLIHSLKYNDRAKLGLELGRHLGQLISPETFGHVDLLTAVPLHRVKLRDRGYNQAEWIGKGAAEIWHIPFKKQIIKRNRFTVSQTTLNKEERKTNMDNAFSVKRNVENMSIVIFDDVLTTGSTMSACALSLKKAGAAQVSALTVSTPMDAH
jgi:ComF family protein